MSDILLNKLITKSEFEILTEFLGDMIGNLKEFSANEDVVDAYNKASFVITLGTMIDIDQVPDDIPIKFKMVEEGVTKDDIKNMIENESKEDKDGSPILKKDFIKLLADANTLKEDVDAKRHLITVVESVVRKFKPILDVYNDKNW